MQTYSRYTITVSENLTMYRNTYDNSITFLLFVMTQQKSHNIIAQNFEKNFRKVFTKVKHCATLGAFKEIVELICF